MIVKGIIKSIDFGSNTCMVRIPTWEPVGNPETVIPAVFSVTPGTFNSYKENDVVWVAFENNVASKPVVIGKLYAGTNADKTEPRGVVNCQSLTVSDSAVLPASTKITQATSDILDERNGLKVQTLDELITAVAENAATISNLVILEENPTLGSVTYSFAFSTSDISVVQPTDADWNTLNDIAGDTSELTKDDLTSAQLATLSEAVLLWLDAGGKWLKGSDKADDPNNWVPQTGYIPEEDWQKNYAGKDAYPLLNVFKRTRSVYYQQGLDKVVTTEELVRSPRTSYPTEYSLKITSSTHAGAAQTENIYVTAVKRFAGSLEEEDTEAVLWYWNPNLREWVTAQAEYKFNFTPSNFQNIIKDRDLVVIATHVETFDPNIITDGTKRPDPLEQEALSTWGALVLDERVYEIETIPYSPLNTPVINLDNDSAALPYNEDGETVLYSSTVSSTAQVFLNGEDISGDFTFTWYQEKTPISDVNSNTPTITISAAGAYNVVAKKKDGISSSYSVPENGLIKTFTVAKQLQGEAMMSSVITSSAGTSFNTKDTKNLTTTLTAYLYRGTEEYKPEGKDLYYKWHTISEDADGKEIDDELKEGTDYTLEDPSDETHKSIKMNVISLRNKSIYFIAYKDKQYEETDSVLNVARLGITLLGKN